eukprot:1867502-Pleurochrysis_carterae.AAC.1
MCILPEHYPPSCVRITISSGVHKSLSHWARINHHLIGCAYIIMGALCLVAPPEVEDAQLLLHQHSDHAADEDGQVHAIDAVNREGARVK